MDYKVLAINFIISKLYIISNFTLKCCLFRPHHFLYNRGSNILFTLNRY